MKYTNIIKRETKVMVLMVVALLGLVLGVSYAMFMDVKDNTNNQIVTAGTLQVEYSSNNGYLNGETYKDIIPMSDSDGLEQTGYNFSVKNTGNLATSYQVFLYVNEEEFNADKQAGTITGDLFTEIENIKYNLITNSVPNETVTQLSEVDSKEENNITKYLLYTGTLEQTNDTNIHSLKLWLDPEDMDTEYIGKYVYLKLQVNNYVKGQEPVICKRATELHSDGTNTFGNLGTKGTLASGDAFDCDVNGDGVYNAGNERFYYVSNYYNTTTKEFENDTAVLIYYNNTSGGVASNTDGYAYDNSGNSSDGPVVAVEQLPTTNQWNNVILKKSNRTLLNENNVGLAVDLNLPGNEKDLFDYSNYAARLLTYQELVSGCGNETPTSLGYLDNCTYLMENTVYSNSNYLIGYWLETTRANYSYAVWYTTSGNHNLDIQNSKISYGVRPVIEVPKVEIDY